MMSGDTTRIAHSERYGFCALTRVIAIPGGVTEQEMLGAMSGTPNASPLVMGKFRDVDGERVYLLEAYIADDTPMWRVHERIHEFLVTVNRFKGHLRASISRGEIGRSAPHGEGRAMNR